MTGSHAYMFVYSSASAWFGGNERAVFALLATTKPTLITDHCSPSNKRQLSLLWPMAVARLAGPWGEREECEVCVCETEKERVKGVKGRRLGAGQRHNAPLNPQRRDRNDEWAPMRQWQEGWGGAGRPITLCRPMLSLHFASADRQWTEISCLCRLKTHTSSFKHGVT